MKQQRGFSMIEVLVTIVILSFGLLGLAGLQARAMSMEMDSYQRAQALVLLNTIADTAIIPSAGAIEAPESPIIGARYCVTLIQALDDTTGVCQPQILEVSVVWQGIGETVAPHVDCGAGLYGGEALRRAITLRKYFATTGCKL